MIFIELRVLEYFLAVAREQNISRAAEYLHLAKRTEVEMKIDTVPTWRGLTGCSLAGLFAIYSLYQTPLFQRATSMSGSLWFPGFKEYAVSHEMKANLSHLYFSLGDLECHTRNPYLKTVQENTEQLETFYKSKNVNTIFCQTSGGHSKNASK